MAAPDNPFLPIVPREEDLLVDKTELIDELKELSKDALEGKVVIILKGTYGSGKTLVSEHIAKFLAKKGVDVRRLSCTQGIFDDVRSLPEEHRKDVFIFMEGLDVCAGMDDRTTNKLLDLIAEKSSKGLSFMLECTPDVIKRFQSLNRRFSGLSKVVEVPPMSYDDARKLVVSRLNEIRDKKSDSIEPFTEPELKEYWKASQGNPRMILMLCQSLYDRKAQ